MVKLSNSFIRRLALAVCTCFFICAAIFYSACSEKYPNVSNDVKNYYKQTIVLQAGQSYTFDFGEIFGQSGLTVEKYKIEQSEGYSVKGDSITAKGTGITPINVSLFVPGNHTRYICSVGTLYSYDEKDFTSISTAEQLSGITDLGGKYILTADIDLSTVENWEPIGNTPAGNAFTGMFINPRGYKIENLTISTSTEIFNGPYGGCNGGMFGSAEGAFISGIKLENVNIDVSDFSGGLFSYAGGIVALSNSSYIKDCSVNGSIKANGAAGGIAGSVSWGLIENCAFSGDVCTDENLSEYALKSPDTGAGGIAGYCGIPCPFEVYQYGLINCVADGTVSAVKNAGGIAAYIWGAAYAKNCSFTGNTSAVSTSDTFATVQESIHA